ncbi:hypothetical protein [Fimbriimonas ginsengisoli]|uniref:Cytoplasmic protein n=1 Tax=Fimbriimonas ginsengisoli Gsoil 348 TaxID=661478 RepID=A0A068NJF4_FIMGI|nr:hypothetical protein [Fimbriimonas ginsengisoli]AIE83748.1 hypothetical protein OP10G_0380 [Fimbriimonas ginsengisoli Gsoil 348]
MSTDLSALHRRSSHHRYEVEKSVECGCFHCLAIYPPEEIVEWIDQDQTALCPRCKIDSVIGFDSPVSVDLLGQMRDYWFSTQ